MKTYLGDGVFVDFDGEFILIFTGDGIEYSKPIYLEPRVVTELIIYIRKIHETPSV